MTTKLKHHRTALIDGDIVVWKASAFAHDHQGDELELEERVVWDVGDWMRRAFCSAAIVCFSGPRDSNFRRDAWPLYKTNRKDERPEFHGMAVDILKENFKVFQRETLEADDCMGLLATMGTIENPVIVSIDKDMRTIPGWHFNPDKDDFPLHVSYDWAEYSFLLQWAMGDRVDGYKGIEKVGQKGAEKILRGSGESGVRAVLDAYRDKGHTWNYALAQARCARILTVDNWDLDTKKPILWSPLSIDTEGLEDWIAADEDR